MEYMEEAINISEPPVAPIITSRKLASQTVLERRLQSLDSPAASQLDPTFITNAEYQLFIDDMQAQDRYFQPLHWTEETFPAGQADQPVTGVTPYGAFEFCNWLTEKYGGSAVRYRLPNSSELPETPSNDWPDVPMAWHQSAIKEFVLPPLNQAQLQLLTDTFSQSDSAVLLPSFTKLEDYLDFERTILQDVSHSLDGVRDSLFELESVYFSDLDYAFDYSPKLATDLTIARAIDLKIVNDLALHLSQEFANSYAHYKEVKKAVKTKDYALALEIIQDFLQNEPELDIATQGLATLFLDILHILLAETPVKQRRAACTYFLHYFEYLWIGCGLAIEYHKKQIAKPSKKGLAILLDSHYYPKKHWAARLLLFRENRKNAIKSYWGLQLIAAREAQQLPAWEGIRLVRERLESGN